MQVLLATDGSESAVVALDLVASLPWPSGTTIRVIEVIETLDELFGAPWPTVATVDPALLEADLRASARETLDQSRSRLTGPGLTIETAVLHGRPASVVVAEAQAARSDLIIVGSRGHGSIERMLLGSVSAEVVDHAPAPVLVARARAVDRIVFGWDGSASAELAATTLRWPIFAEMPIRVVSVAAGAVPWWTGLPAPGAMELMPLYLESADASRHEHERLANELAGELRDAGLAAEAEVRVGDPAAEILAAAAAVSADLIVVGTHGRTGISGLLLGSVARNVLGHALASVLVVREPRSSS
jgi:nucleotide-binding universal stress UspA family protein